MFLAKKTPNIPLFNSWCLVSWHCHDPAYAILIRVLRVVSDSNTISHKMWNVKEARNRELKAIALGLESFFFTWFKATLLNGILIIKAFLELMKLEVWRKTCSGLRYAFSLRACLTTSWK